ncbi:MAG: HAMP domain-containing sensor histidine kinase [Chloroflexota bacterium]
MSLTPTERLLRQTRRRLFLVTLGLLVLLVVGVGAATAVVTLRALDADVDRSLEAAVSAQVAALDGELPSGDESGEVRDHAPASADTVVLVLGPDGMEVVNPSGIAIAGLPDPGSATAARTSSAGRDLRTINAGARSLRVLTQRFGDPSGPPAGFVQAGFVLDLHERQSRSIVLAILLVGALGLVAAALITLLVTGRALSPIRETFETQRRFVADASHELRTPAALIRANAEVLEREGLVAEDGRDLLEDIIAEADRLGGLVGDLLQLAAWDETRLVLSLAPEDVASIARTTVRGATALAAGRGVTLKVDAPGPAPAHVDRSRLVQLLLVLVDNAIDHSPAGTEVVVRVRAPKGQALIEVDDQGPGVPPADRKRIFEPFTRLPGSTRHGSGGTGLGLAIARRIAEAHGGTIEAGEPPAGGARFIVLLPASSGGTTVQTET